MTRSESLRPAAGHAAPFAGLVRSTAGFVGLLVAATLVAASVATGVTDVGPVPGISRPPAAIRFGIPVARALVILAAVASAGAALLPRLLGPAEAPRQASARRRVLAQALTIGIWASAIWAVAALALLWLMVGELAADPGTLVPSPADLGHYLANVAAGRGLLITAACALVSLVLGLVARRGAERVPSEVRVGIVLFGLLPLPLTGHASTRYWHDLAMIAMELHVVAATVWVGGLAAVTLLLGRRPLLLATALPRLSAVATWCVLTVGVSGLFAGLVELALSPTTALPGSLVTTKYGVLLVAKMLCLAVIAAIAVVVRNRLLPAVRSGRPSLVTLWCGWELMVMALAFGIAVVLTRAAVVPF